MIMSAHLSDDRLIEVCLDRVPEPREQRHLDGCPECEQRRSDLAQLLADVSDVAIAEADVAFPAERLVRQQARILHRLEHEGRPARVIAFPAGHGHDVTPLRARPGMRWVAAAAAAGLVIGLVAGHLAHDLPVAGTSPRQAPGTGTLQAVSTSLSEEEFLGQLEVAIQGGSTALRPLDDLTPRVWEVAAR
jgi:hypothetical protein